MDNWPRESAAHCPRGNVFVCCFRVSRCSADDTCLLIIRIREPNGTQRVFVGCYVSAATCGLEMESGYRRTQTQVLVYSHIKAARVVHFILYITITIWCYAYLCQCIQCHLNTIRLQITRTLLRASLFDNVTVARFIFLGTFISMLLLTRLFISRLFETFIFAPKFWYYVLTNFVVYLVNKLNNYNKTVQLQSTC